MGTLPIPLRPEDEGLITVQDFAGRYRVEASIVRSWVKKGYINYVLVGPRHMKHIRLAEIIKPVQPNVSPAELAIRRLMERDGMDRGTAELVVSSMEPNDVAAIAQEGALA